jgi:hypothetical protein
MDVAIGVLDDLVTNAVGTGLGIEPMVRNAAREPIDALNTELSQL